MSVVHDYSIEVARTHPTAKAPCRMNWHWHQSADHRAAISRARPRHREGHGAGAGAHETRTLVGRSPGWDGHTNWLWTLRGPAKNAAAPRPQPGRTAAVNRRCPLSRLCRGAGAQDFPPGCSQGCCWPGQFQYSAQCHSLWSPRDTRLSLGMYQKRGCRRNRRREVEHSTGVLGPCFGRGCQSALAFWRGTPSRPSQFLREKLMLTRALPGSLTASCCQFLPRLSLQQGFPRNRPTGRARQRLEGER